jgi:hypothetical protein
MDPDQNGAYVQLLVTGSSVCLSDMFVKMETDFPILWFLEKSVDAGAA